MESELSAVAALLRGEPDQDAPEGAIDQDIQEPEAAPSAGESGDLEQPEAEETSGEGQESYSVKDLAEKLGMRPQDVYSKVKIDIGGESLSLGEFKDRAKELKRFDTLMAEAEERRTSVENDLAKQRQELEVAAKLPNMKPEERAEHVRQYVETETQKAIESIQGWTDAGTRTQELGEITALLTEYGMSGAQIGQIVDATAIRILADYNRLRKRVKQATESTVKSPKRQQGQANHAPSTKTPAKRAVEGYKAGKVPQMSAVAALIADGVKRNG